jgi:4-amino-4-deoxy-L-arabinose transferase-like glycosyltransferase
MQQLKDAGIILLITLAILLPQFAGYPLLEPDEARYSEIPREMFATKDYIIPHLNGIIYLEKPPFFYWLQTLSIKAFGINEVALRFWNAFFASLSCIMVYLGGSTLYNRKTGWIAASLLFTSLLFYAMAHFITLDMTLCGLITGCLFSMIISLNKPSPLAARLWCYASYIFAALALLTKGLVGILLPGSIFILWIMATQQWSALKRIHLFTGLVIFFAIALPWHILAQQRVPEFFDFYIIGQHFKRYLTMSEGRYQPAWFFMVILFAGLMPWIFFALQAAIRQANQIRFSCKQYSTETFLLIWSAFIFIFFTFSKSKLVPYILPVLPPLMLLLSHDLLTFSRKRWEWIATLCLVFAAGVGLILMPYFADRMLEPHILENQHATIITLAAMTFITFAICLVLVLKHKAVAPFIALGAGCVIAFGTAVPLASKLSDRSIKPLATIIKARIGEYDEVVSFQKYIQDLPVYTEQVVTVVDRKDELDFGMTLEDTSQHMINYDTFMQRWNTPDHTMFVVVSVKKFDHFFAHDPKVHVLGATSRYVLISNQGG